MIVDNLIQGIMSKKNPCIVGLDPEWHKIPDCYKESNPSNASTILKWSLDIIDVIHDVVPAIKPQSAFFEVYGWQGNRVYEEIVHYAHSKNLIVIDDSKRNDIGNTSKAYAFSHLSQHGPLKADFMTVSPFLGTDSIQPYIDLAIEEEKGIFILVKTSNVGSSEISEATNKDGEQIYQWLAKYIDSVSSRSIGNFGYSGIGAVVGGTFPNEAQILRKIMKKCFFLVPGFGAQGGDAKSIMSCFNDDGLGAVINSSRAILYHYLNTDDFDNKRSTYLETVRAQAISMRNTVYSELKTTYPELTY